MDLAINKICKARFCIPCALELEQTHVVRCDGDMNKSFCDRCGRETVTMAYRYTMSGKELRRRGLV